MKKLMFAEAQQDSLTLESLCPDSALPGDDGAQLPPNEAAPTDLILVSRLDYEVHAIEVPPLPQKELGNLLAYRLRMMHPGAPELTLFDYVRDTSTQGKDRATVYVMRADVHECYRAFAHRALLVSSDILCRAAMPEVGNRTVLLLLPHYLEVIEFRGSSLSASRIARISDTDSQEIQLLSVLSPAEIDGNLIVIGADRRLTEGRVNGFASFTPLFEHASVMTFADIVQAPHGRSNRFSRMPRLFEPVERRKRRDTGKLGSLLIGSAFAAALLLCLLYGYRVVHGFEYRLSQVRTEYLRVRQTLAGKAREVQQIKSAEAELQKLAENRPPDVYAFFSSIARSAPGPITVIDLTLNGQAFTLQGYISHKSVSAFDFAENLARDSRFHHVQIVQLVPDPSTGDVQFTIIGDYYGR